MKTAPVHITEAEAFKKMAFACARREYASVDILKKLQKYDLTPEATASILSRLQKERYVDDVRFCRGYIRDKLKFAKWGKVKIAYHLRGKGISSEVIHSAMQEFSDENPLDVLQPLLHNKLKTIKGNTAYEIKGKLIRFALGRGFQMDDILKVVETIEIK